MPRLDIEYARVSDDRYINIYMLISCFHPKNDDVRRDSNLYLVYSLLTSPVQPDDAPFIRPKHVVVFLHTAVM